MQTFYKGVMEIHHHARDRESQVSLHIECH